jgi:LacI family transcriptional regulator
LRVPEDFAIVGTANESFTALTTPSMSSVDQHPSDIGRQAAEAMLRLLKGDTAGEEIIVDTELIVRESTGGKNN